MGLNKFQFVVFSFILFQVLQAAEIDSFTARYTPLADSSEKIDQLANKHLQQALERANEKGRCSERELLKALRDHFQIILFGGKFMDELMTSSEITRRAVPRAESIYKHHTRNDGRLLVRPMADQDGIGMGAMIRYGDLYIGTDKFEHLFGRGYIYYYEHFVRGLPLDLVLETSVRDERLILGGNRFLTGVFSYADLVSNFNGIRFWNDFLKKSKDLLGRELEPVIRCSQSQWVQNRHLTFAHYFDEGSDEAFNCSALATNEGRNGVLKALVDLKNQDPTNEYRCPLNSEKIQILKEKYQHFSPWLFNFEGIKTFKYNFPAAQSVDFSNAP